MQARLKMEELKIGLKKHQQKKNEILEKSEERRLSRSK